MLPAHMRRSPKVTEVVPLLYMRGLSAGDFGPSRGFLRFQAGLSASTICRLAEAPQAELEEWKRRDLSAVGYVTGGPTACTSTAASKRTGCAAW